EKRWRRSSGRGIRHGTHEIGEING
ncbi:hypothetical protein CCACVL1_18961, partial [Corchorus capsularis]